MDQDTLTGRCLCESVRFQIRRDAVLLFNTCYCGKCRRNSGTGFVAQLQVEGGGFAWSEGETHISHYQSSPGVFRSFCSNCGSRVPMTRLPGDIVPVPVGLLDQDPGMFPEVNMHVGERPTWALLDESIATVQDSGSEEFWREFMKRKGTDTQ